MSLLAYYSTLTEAAAAILAFGWDSTTKGANWTLSNSNLTATSSSGSSNTSVYTTSKSPVSKIYIELTMTTTYSGGSGYPIVGLADNNTHGSSYIGNYTNSLGAYMTNAVTSDGGGITQSRATGITYANGDTLMLAIDASGGNVWYGKNGTWSGSFDPGSGSSPNFTCPSSTGWYLTMSDTNTNVATLPTSTVALVYQAPGGFTGWDALQQNIAAVYWNNLLRPYWFTLTNNQTTINDSIDGSWATAYLYPTISTGNRYIEFVWVDEISAGQMNIGLTDNPVFVNSESAGSTELGADFQNSVALKNNGGGGAATFTVATAGGSHAISVASLVSPPVISNGSIINMAINFTLGYVWFGVNGTWFTTTAGTGNPVTGVNPTISGSAFTFGATWSVGMSATNTPGEVTVQGVSSSWTYTRPTGYVGFDGS